MISAKNEETIHTMYILMEANVCLSLKLHIWVQDHPKVVRGMVRGVVRGLFGYFWRARHGAWGGAR